MYGQMCSLISAQTYTCNSQQKTGLDICFQKLKGGGGGILQEYEGPQREKMGNMMGLALCNMDRTFCGFCQSLGKDVNYLSKLPKKA